MFYFSALILFATAAVQPVKLPKPPAPNGYTPKIVVVTVPTRPTYVPPTPTIKPVSLAAPKSH